jgi:hypothetical protein
MLSQAQQTVNRKGREREAKKFALLIIDHGSITHHPIVQTTGVDSAR